MEGLADAAGATRPVGVTGLDICIHSSGTGRRLGCCWALTVWKTPASRNRLPLRDRNSVDHLDVIAQNGRVMTGTMSVSTTLVLTLSPARQR